MRAYFIDQEFRLPVTFAGDWRGIYGSSEIGLELLWYAVAVVAALQVIDAEEKQGG